MVYTPKQLADFDIIAELREFAKMADKRITRRDITLAKKVALMKVAKLARAEASRIYGAMQFDRAA